MAVWRVFLQRYGIKVGRKALSSGKGFAKAMGLHEWSRIERAELKAEIAAAAKTLPGYENLISIKGIGEIGAVVLLSSIVDIGSFTKSGTLLPSSA